MLSTRRVQESWGSVGVFQLRCKFYSADLLLFHRLRIDHYMRFQNGFLSCFHHFPVIPLVCNLDLDPPEFCPIPILIAVIILVGLPSFKWVWI